MEIIFTKRSYGTKSMFYLFYLPTNRSYGTVNGMTIIDLLNLSRRDIS
ncbi:hypothetical protein [Moheibacter stercoris]|uniref:Uncharacterized protein n=1 Tax=Moheibacter stercoris TaxID=1628251 RepID=A0ABV2LUH2_9FLAO